MTKVHIRLGSQGAYSVMPKCQAKMNRRYLGMNSCVHPTEFAKLDASVQCAHCLKLLIKARAKRDQSKI